MFLDYAVQNLEDNFRESLTKMKENQKISFDDFIADIVVGLDSKYKELFCAEIENCGHGRIVT